MSDGWSLTDSPWKLGIALVFSLVSTWYFVRAFRREGDSRGKIFLHVVRLVLCLLVALTLLKPERVTVKPRVGKPRVAVLWDESGSMETQDVVAGAGKVISRRAWLAEKQKAKFWGPLLEKYEVSTIPFAVMPKADAPEAGAAGTDINTPLANTASQFTDLRAVILMSDGDWNLGGRPVTAATMLSQRGVPVFAVGVGSDAYLPDVELKDVKAPLYGLVEERVPVMFTVANHLDREVTVKVDVSDKVGVVGAKELVIPPNSERQDSVLLTPTREGEVKYQVSFPAVDGELFAENNSKDFSLDVRRAVLKVLVVDSLPRWEFRYLRNALSRDKSIDLSCLLFLPELGLGAGEFYLNEFPAKPEDLQKYDVVFLGDVGVMKGQLTKENMKALRGLVEDQASGLVFLPGAQGYEQSLEDSDIGQLIPVELDYGKGVGLAGELESRLDLTFRGKDHWLTMLGGDAVSNQQIWRQLPGFYWHAPVVRAKAGAEVLAVHEVARNDHGRIPLLVTKNQGKGKVFFMGTDAAWRWRRGVEDTFHYRFWGQVVRWMAHQRHQAQGDGIRFIYSPETPKRGETLALSVNLLDQLGMPLNRADAQVVITAPSGVTDTIHLKPGEGDWGLYTGIFSIQEGGVHDVEVKSLKSKRSMKTKIDVAVPSLEKVGAPAQGETLREIAGTTGGRFGNTSELEALVKSISVLPEVPPVTKLFQLWCHPIWCAFVLGIFVVYLIGRKLVGLS